MRTNKFVKKNYVNELLAIIKGNFTENELKKKIANYHEKDIADALTHLTEQERKRVYGILGAKNVAEIFTYIDDVEKYFGELSLEKAVKVVSFMDSDEAVDLIESLDKDKREELVNNLQGSLKIDIKKILSYDEEEIGSYMTTNYICIHNDLTIGKAMKELIKQAGDNDNISTIFAVTDRGEFYGALDLKDLITARQDHPMEELIVTSYPYVYGTEQIDDCMERLKDYSEDSIPVLDDDNRSAGIIDLVDDEMGEDYAKLAGLTAEEDLKEPLFESMKKRMPWLIVLLGLGMVVSSVVGMFEKVVTCLPIIMCFQSLILDMAGNVGTQSLAVTIRVLMDETLTGRQKAELVLKEMRIGLCNGGLLGILSFVLIGLYIFLFKGKTLVFAYAVSGCIGLSLLVAMLVSSAVGTCIPLFFKKVGVDPAVASGPLITTMNDLVAVITYYGMSWIFLIEMFHLAG